MASEPGPSEPAAGGPQAKDIRGANKPPTSGDASFSSFDGASFDASHPPVSHIGDAPLSKSEGKRAAKPDRTSSREEFIEEMKASASAGPGRSGRKASCGPARRREGGHGTVADHTEATKEDQLPTKARAPASAPAPAPAAAKPSGDVKMERLRAWIVEQCGLDADASASYAEALVREGVDRPSDLGGLEEADWPSAIKPLHLKRIKAAAAKGSFEMAEGVGLAC